VTRSWCFLVCLLASGCSVFGMGSNGLTKRCERALPTIDTGIALAAVVIAIGVESASDEADDPPTTELTALALAYGASAFVGYSKAKSCSRRAEDAAPALVYSVSDEFLGERQWRTTMWVYPRESPLVALERAYQRAATICEGRGLSALDATRLEPHRPTQVALTYRCH
jgi:hypothetical protein